jgi:hypothetical protein
VLTAEAHKVTLKEALDRYTAEITPTKRGWSSKETYIARAIQRMPIADLFLAAIRSADVAAFIRDLQAKGLGPQRVRLYLELLSHLFTIARTEWGVWKR